MDKYIIVTLKLKKEGSYYVSECVELGTTSFGDTEAEALDSIIDATVLYLNTLEDIGECDEGLREKGVKIHSGPAASARLRCPERSNIHAATIPLNIRAYA